MKQGKPNFVCGFSCAWTEVSSLISPRVFPGTPVFVPPAKINAGRESRVEFMSVLITGISVTLKIESVK